MPVHELDDITNADESLETFKSPAPLITSDCAAPLITASTLGTNEVTDTMSNTPAWK